MNEHAANRLPEKGKWKTLLIAAVPIALCVLGVSLLFARQFFVLEIINNFRLQFSVVMLICSGLLFVMGNRKLSFVQAAVGILVSWPLLTNWLPVSQPAASEPTISLMSFNVLGDNTDQQPVLDILCNNITDLLVVVEYEGDWLESLEPLSKSYSFSVKEHRWHGFGIAMYSRYPILDYQVHALTKRDTDIPMIAATIDVRGQIFNLFACHFLAPLTPMKMDIRNRQMKQVAAIVQNRTRQNGHPAILVGDFNCVAWSPFAVDLMKQTGLRDSRRGYFYQGSWPVDLSLVSIPIDNAFVSDEIHVHDRSILPAAASDHFPMLLEFSIAGVKDETGASQPEESE